MYQKTLEKQWEDLVTDFISENKQKPAEARTLAALAEWYRVNAFRFNNLTAIECITLDQLKAPEFARELRDQLRNFSFRKVEAAEPPKLVKVLLISLVSGIAVPLILPLVPFFWTKLLWVRLLSAGLTFVVVGSVQIARAGTARDKDQERVFQTYTQQLRDYLPELLEVCSRHNIP